MTAGMKKLVSILAPMALGGIIACMAPPGELTREAMIYMGIFLCAIIWLVLNVIDDYIVVILAMALFVVFNITSISSAFSPFAGSSVWLVIGAFGISAVIGKTGLLKRIAFAILKIFPENFRGQILALFTTGLIISPLIPSLTAKASILAPFSATAATALGFEKGSKGARGIFAAMWLSSGIFGMAFLSGAVPVFTILGFLSDEEKAVFTWFKWLAASWVWLVVLAVLSFVAIMVICNPEKENRGQKVEAGFAKKSLEALGPMSKDEKLSAVFLALALVGWMTGSIHGIDSGIWAVIIMCLMAVTGLLSKKEFLTKISWPTVFFIGGVFSIAAQIQKLGIDQWLATILSPILAPVVGNVYILIPMICITTYLLRCVIISQTAVTAIFFATLGGISRAAGINPWVILFVCYTSTLVWHFSFTNTTYVAAFGATGGDMVEHNDNQPMNIAYMVINLIACTASIPLWHLMGFL